MEELVKYLESTLDDEILSKSEKRAFKAMLAQKAPDQNQLNFLRSKIYEMASARANDQNFPLIFNWVKEATSALLSPAPDSVDAYFSPGESCRSAIINQIRSSISQLQICVFTISDDFITNALLTAHKKGVKIKVITDNDKSEDEGSDIEQLHRAGISVRMDNSPNHMHHKFMVSDSRTLITGSYNWTRSAALYNHENVLQTTETGAVRAFLRQFDNLWNVMTPFK